MAYIVQGDLDVYLSDDDLIALTDDTNTGSASSARISECMTAAEGEVDSFLANRYTVPITTTVPEIVKEWCVQLTVLRLHQRRLNVPPDVWEMAREARRQLGLVASGVISLDIGTDAPDEPSGREIQFNSNTRGFSRTTLADW